jgi:hypothetical protein
MVPCVVRASKSGATDPRRRAGMIEVLWMMERKQGECRSEKLYCVRPDRSTAEHAIDTANDGIIFSRSWIYVR